MEKFNKYCTRGLAAVGLLGSSVVSYAAAPLELGPTGTEVVGYIGTAATAGLGVFGAIYGIRMILRAFKAVK